MEKENWRNKKGAKNNPRPERLVSHSVRCGIPVYLQGVQTDLAALK